MNSRNLVISGIFAAIICIFSVICVPIGTVPVTLSLFAVILASVVLGAKNSFMAIASYILLGAVGLPVFSGFQSGFVVLFGPTGGYIWSYMFISLIVGCSSDKSTLHICVSAAISLIISYFLGTMQFALVQSVSFVGALSVCVLPFVVFDIIKLIAAVKLGIIVRKRLYMQNKRM